MDKTFYFLSGLPRSGNTLLSSILNQNPTVHVSSLSPVVDYLWSAYSISLNDQNAIKNCVESEKGLGFIIISGIAKYDNSKSEFKKWHDNLKGGTSTYEKERVARGAPSRRRKISFEPENLHALWFDDVGELNSAVRDGWLKSFQTDMKNSNGKPRPAKFQFNLGKVSKNNMIAEVKIN